MHEQHLTVCNVLNPQTVDITREVKERLSEKVHNHIV